MSVPIETGFPVHLQGDVIREGMPEFEYLLDEVKDPDSLGGAFVLDADSRQRLHAFRKESGFNRDDFPWDAPTSRLNYRDLEDQVDAAMDWLGRLPIAGSQRVVLSGGYVLSFSLLIRCFQNIDLRVGSGEWVIDHTMRWMLTFDHEESLSFFLREGRESASR